MSRAKLRAEVFNKFDGRCAYCGCDLKKGWHVDHIQPVLRTKKIGRDGDGKLVWRTIGVLHPELETIDNLFPACASCNINKHSQTIEQFRAMILKFIESLNQYSVQYKIAKRYGLVEELDQQVVFYFETIRAEKAF